MIREYYFEVNRTMCDVLDEMRKSLELVDNSDICLKRHKAYMGHLIEEMQTYGNRMEAALSDVHDLKEIYKTRKKLKKEIKRLVEQRDKIKEDDDE